MGKKKKNDDFTPEPWVDFSAAEDTKGPSFVLKPGREADRKIKRAGNKVEDNLRKKYGIIWKIKKMNKR